MKNSFIITFNDLINKNKNIFEKLLITQGENTNKLIAQIKC